VKKIFAFYLILFIIIILLFYSYVADKYALFFIILLNTVLFFAGAIIQIIDQAYYYNLLYSLSLNTSRFLSLSLVTGIFTQLNYGQIVANMVILFLIGAPFEERVKSRKFLILYLSSGIIAELVFSVIYSSTQSYLLGASGAIFGIMGSFLVLYPDDEIPMLLGFIFMPKIKVKYAVLFYAAIEFLATAIFENNGVAHLAHVSGFVAGAVIAYYLVHPSQKPMILDIELLRKLAGTDPLNKLVDKIESEKIEEVRKIWIEQFFNNLYGPGARLKGNYVLVKNNKIKIYRSIQRKAHQHFLKRN
jgi:membrane associated rhomboid family serine protease